MRLAVIATNRNPLSRPHAGGQERLTADLVRGFRSRGHHVALFAARGTPADLADELYVYGDLPPMSATALTDAQMPEPWFLTDHHAYTAACAQLATRHDIDAVAHHSLHHLPLSLSRAIPAPVVTTLHTPPYPWMELGAALAAPTASYIAVSEAVARQWTTLTAAVVTNGVDPSSWPLGPGSDDGDLVWVGRLTPEKAPHRAALVAHRLGRRLTIVGPVGDAAYVDTTLVPLAHDGVSLAGHLDGDALASVVGHACAALVTPDWNEPFGLVCLEAAMCGTPVVALGRGGIAEAVPPGAGVVVPDDAGVCEAARLDGLAAGVSRVAGWDRATVRAAATAYGTVDRCIDAHLKHLALAAAKDTRLELTREHARGGGEPRRQAAHRAERTELVR